MPSESNPPYPLPGRPFDLPKPEAPYRPAYFKNTIPSYWRRDKNHDYTRRCIYMLTMRKAPDKPDFSNVFAPDGNPFKPQISLSRLGAIIYHEIHSLSVSFPSVKVFDSVVMPDHIHFVVYLSESGMHPGDIVKKFKGLCSRAWQWLCRGDPSRDGRKRCLWSRRRARCWPDICHNPRGSRPETGATNNAPAR